MSLRLFLFGSGTAIAVAGLSILGGCTTKTEIYDATGQRALLISCDGHAVPMSRCYSRAAKECPAGYQLLDAQNNNQGFIAGPYAASSVNTKSIAVRCKGTGY